VALSAAAGAAVRWRVETHEPLPPAHPAAWFASGLAQDVAVAALFAAVLLIFARTAAREAAARLLLGAGLVAAAAAHFAFAEAVIFFGHPPRWEDLAIGLDPTFLASTATGSLLRLFLLSLSAAVAVVGALAFLSRRATTSRASAGRLALLALASGAAAVALSPFDRDGTGRQPLVALLVAYRERLPPGHGLVFEPTKDLTETSVRELVPFVPPGDFLDARFPLARRAPESAREGSRLAAPAPPNIVFFVLEGLQAQEVGAYGGRPAGLTPNLDRLGREGVRFDRAYSNGTHTPEGELALWYGVLPDPYSHIITDHPGSALTGLPELLTASGWKTLLWMYGGDIGNFYRRDRFYPRRGFRIIERKDFSPGQAETSWGYSDMAVARKAAAVLDNAAEPFAAMVLTVTNHHPFVVPTDGSPLPWQPGLSAGFLRLPGSSEEFTAGFVPLLDTSHYSDEAVGEFLRLSRGKPWFRRTLFVFTGDHGLALASVRRGMTPHQWEELRHRVPLILYSPLLPGGRVVAGPVSHADMMPTLLDLAGVGLPRAGAGAALLDPPRTDPARPIVTWSAEGGTVSVVTASRIYHAVVPREPPPPGHPIRVESEWLVDPAADPAGARNLASSEPEKVAAMRRLARVYMQVYPWLLVQGRSGNPP
jgi:arylsulfatase A-like enzyme